MSLLVFKRKCMKLLYPFYSGPCRLRSPSIHCRRGAAMIKSSKQWMLVLLLLCTSTFLYSFKTLYPRGTQELVQGANEMMRSVAGGIFNTRLQGNSSQLIYVAREDQHDRWIVVTSIAPPTDDVKFLASLPGWKVVVVGDTKSPKNWRYPNCVFLDITSQESLGLSIASKLPYKSYTRKNIGYLYAIARGAKIIYETDDDNRPLDGLRSFILSETTPGLLYAGSRIFNPYIHFGQSTLWPRGYPLGAVGSDQTMEYRLNKDWRTPLIQQGIVNGDPDMDAIFRLTRKKTLTPLEVAFDPAAPPVILPEGVFSPFNSQNTLFLHGALWALMLPTTTPFRMCDIWRGYWAQRLLWEIGGNLGFSPPNAYQLRNAHNYMADAEDERSMYYDTDRLIDFLGKWTCEKQRSFFDCVKTLSADMATEGFWGKDDATVTSLWIADLLNLGYEEPIRTTVSLEPKVLTASKKKYDSSGYSQSNTDLAKRWLKSVEKGSFSTFVAAEQLEPSIHQRSSQSHCVGTDKHITAVAEFCKSVKNFTINNDVIASRHRGSFHNVLVVVVFNFIRWFSNSLPALEVMHRAIFPNMVYCGEDPIGSVVKAAMKERGIQVSFIHAHMKDGFTGYNCFSLATKMNYNVTDYLILSDDTLLNTWNLEVLDRNKIWKSPRITWSCKQQKRWGTWNKDRPKVVAGLQELKKKYNNSEIAPGLTYQKFMSNLGADTCMWSISDNYYVPQRYVTALVTLFEHFTAKDILLEILTPMLIHGAAPETDIITFDVKDLWIDDRNKPWEFYAPATSHFLHPVKWSDKKNLEPLCRWHLHHLLNYQQSQSKQFKYVGKRANEVLRKWNPP